MHKICKIFIVPLFFAVLILTAWPAGAEVVVQVMSVQDEAAAKKEADRLFDQGVPSFSRAENVPDLGVWNRVYVGPFETEADASVAAETLKKQGVIKDFVVKTGTAPAVDATSGQPATAPGDGLPAVAGTPAAGPNEDGTFELPVAQTPTYGEPVSPEMARDLGLTEENANRLPTYGETTPAVPVDPITGANSPEGAGGLSTYGESAAASPRVPPAGEPGQLPPGLVPGDDMPGLVINGGAAPAPVPAPQDTASSPEPVSSAAPPAPSAGDWDGPVMVAQTSFEYNTFDDDHRVSLSRPRDINGFTLLVDLSSSMRRLSNCPSHVKEEAVAALLRKMNRRIPGKPYNASLRVFGYKKPTITTWRPQDLTTLYYGPATYNRDGMEDALARLVAADSVSPFADALKASDEELRSMGSPKAVLMFSDFESNQTSGTPVQNAANLRRRYGQDVEIFTFHATRQLAAVKLARSIAEAGGGKAYDICRMLNDEAAFENMMMEIFGPGGSACADQDGDGVCDEDALCPDTPPGVAVDSRGCWVAAYSQFFDFDKDEVKSEFLPRLQHAVNVLKKNPGITRVIIAGHTDNIGKPEYNLELGRRRAQAVKNILVGSGISRDRLIVESYGETRPIGPNDTEEGRARNRRVEFHVGDMPPKSYQN